MASATAVQSTQSTVPACQSVPRRRPSAAILAIPGVLLVLACLLPYLNTAYTIDDPWFLLEARQILKTPLQPMSYAICSMGTELCLLRASSLGSGSTQALMGYLLVPVTLAGGAEWMAHLLQILLACLAVLEMVRLALRFGFNRVQSTAAGLMLTAVPPLLPLANSAMPDVAALALGLTGMEHLLAWKDERRWYQAAIASVGLGLAPFARPHLALFLPLGALWLWNEFRIRRMLEQFRQEASLWAPILIAGCVLIAVNLLTHDRSPVYESRQVLASLRHVPRNLYSYGMYMLFPIPFAAVWLAMGWRKTPMLLVVPAIPVLVLHFAMFPSRSLVQEWPTAVALYGLAALISMIHRYVGERDRIGMLLGLWVLLPVPVTIYFQFPIKYMLAVTPAVVLIVIRTLSTRSRAVEWSAYTAVVLVCSAISCVLLKANADFAEYGRRAAAELIAPHVAAGEKVWYGSGQWGFYWYAQEAGAEVSKPGERGPNPGELLVVGLIEGGGTTLKRFPNRELVESRHYNSPHGRTMEYGGAFYSNVFGDALWVWKPEATNDYEVWRIR
jgi:hypothetical protein